MAPIGALEKYDEHLNSYIEWLGDIPAHWKLKRLKFVVEIVKRIAGKEGFDVLSITQRGIKVKDIESGEGQLAMDYSKYQLLYKDEFAMNHMDLLTGYVDISKYDGVVSPDYRVFRNKSSEVLDSYLLLIFQLGYTQRIFYKYGQGVSFLGRWRFPADNFNNFFIPIPSLEDQRKIVDFISKKTSQIDEAIANKEKQIALLKERKQIIIQKAVTQGLNPNIPTKDSGVDWIGKVPEEWKVESFKNILVERNKKNNPIESRERLSLSIDKGITLYSEKTTNLDRFKDDFAQYKLTHKGDLVFNSMNMIVGAVGVSNYFGCVSPVYYTYYARLENPKITKYYEYFFKSRIVQSQLYCLGKGIMAIDRGEGKFNTVRLKVSRDDLRSMKVPYPTISEITEIVDFIELESSKINKAIRLQEQQIEKLKEYKVALINNAVTGKIKVA